LTISVRAANIHTKANTDTIQSILRHVETQFLSNGYNISDPKIVETLKSDKPINYYQTTSELHGSKLVDDITVNDLKVIKAASSGGKSVAVIANMVDGKIADQTLITKLKDAGFTESDYEVYSPEDFSAKPV